MKKVCLGFLCGMSLVLGSCQTTREANPQKGNASATSSELVEFASEESMERLDRAEARVDFYLLANQFEAQSNGLYCGPTSAAIVLNALRSGKSSAQLPKDRSRMKAEDARYLPKDFDPAVSRYTQESIVAKSSKPKAVIFGKPLRLKDGKTGTDFGFQLRQLDELLRGNGLETTLRVANEKISDETIIAELVKNLKQANNFVLVNYKRAEVGQQGGGHISPLGAYDKDSQSFLVLDVNPSKASWVWMPQATLIKGMRSFDTLENRGYILVRDSKE